MRIFLTGANGYIGGAAAAALIAAGHPFAASFATGPRPTRSRRTASIR